ncbi:mandelate racemase [Actinomyces sp.]|uniref:mandelate racemase n=1 Tax=Actinomyces sp. TaxID=29317 RepID=UPI0026DAEF99|nr:mandelate racemase [Actinomyces sp.]MDO4899174.1 mandelate racemase [Actinomyces sp.]
MDTPVIDAVAVSTPQVSTSAQDEVKADELLTFQIGMLVVAAVLLVMTVVGVALASAPLLIASGLLAVMAALVNVCSGVNIPAA